MIDPELFDISCEVFDLFKNRTDGENKDRDVIHPSDIEQHYYRRRDRPASMEKLLDAFRILEDERLIWRPPSAGGGNYALTSEGKKADLAGVIVNRLRDKEKDVRLVRFEIAEAIFVPLVCIAALGMALFVPTFASMPTNIANLLQIGLLVAAGISFWWAIGLIERFPMEDRFLLRCIGSYEAIQEGNFGKAERLMRKVAQGLLNSKGDLTSWRVTSEEVYQVLSNLGEEIHGRLLQAIRSKSESTLLASANLAKLFVYPSLERLRAAASILKDFDKQEYKHPTHREKLLTYIKMRRPLYFVGVLLIVFLGAALLYFAMHLLSSIVAGVPFNMATCIQGMFPYNYPIFLAPTAAIAGLLIALSRAR